VDLSSGIGVVADVLPGESAVEVFRLGHRPWGDRRCPSYFSL